MKATGIVRRVDELGRIVLPMELRKMHGINVRDALEIYTEDDRIILTKYEPACIFTGETDGLVEYRGRRVSAKAIKEMAGLVD